MVEAEVEVRNDTDIMLLRYVMPIALLHVFIACQPTPNYYYLFCLSSTTDKSDATIGEHNNTPTIIVVLIAAFI
jgi:hypothetical protein